MVTYLWFTPTRTGEFDILCEELCGLGHFAMRGRVVVDDPDDYQAWLAKQPAHAELAGRAPPDAVAGEAAFATCIACHGSRAEGNQALNAPKLAGQPGWYLAKQLRNFRHGIRGEAPGEVIAAQMRAIALTLDDDTIADVVAYIGTLPDDRPRATVQGNTDRGGALYRTCAYCHGATGGGVWTTNAPRLASMSDWYLVRQLDNFQAGLRGRHPHDYYGAQMAQMRDGQGRVRVHPRCEDCPGAEERARRSRRRGRHHPQVRTARAGRGFAGRHRGLRRVIEE